MAHGISHSHYLGGPPVWTDTDRDLAQWYEIHKREACSGCGTRPAEWDPARGGHIHAYVARREKCWGCERRAKAEAAIPEAERQWTHVHLHRNPETC